MAPPSRTSFLALLLAPLAAGQTREESNVPGRYAHCAVVFEDLMVVYGGRGFRAGSNQLSTMGDAWSFHMPSEDWRQIWDTATGAGPEPRSSHSCVLVNERGVKGSRSADILVFGGMKKTSSSGVNTVVNEVWRLGIAQSGVSLTAEWELLTPQGILPPPRFDHAAITWQNGLLVYGGCESSTAMSDVWSLAWDAVSGAWRWDHIEDAPSAPLALAPPPAPPSSSGTNGTQPPPSPPPPRPSPPPPPPYWAGGIPSPGARCAHSAVPVEGGMIIFGGRIPLPQRAIVAANSNEPTWQTLSDGWRFDLSVATSAGGGNGWSAIRLDDGGARSDSSQYNRSDHSCILRDDNLMLFGGLYTDLEQSTIYIMKDFLNLRLLPSNTGGPSDAAFVNRLSWGPAWRFDHSMVLAPRMTHPDPREGGRELINVPLLYGGGGGMEIFADMWVYDFQTSAWARVNTNLSATTRVSLISSLLFGTVGFGLYACVIVCVFIRRIARTRRGFGDWPPGTIPGGPGPPRLPPGARRGCPADVVADLPRLKWSEVASPAYGGDAAAGSPANKLQALPPPATLANGSGGSGSSSGDEAPASETATGGAAVAAVASRGAAAVAADKCAAGLEDDDEAEVCAVCLCTYEPSDILIRLPCDHLFHEHCVARWLAQDSSCPQCRFNLAPQPQLHHVAGGRSAPDDDLEAGTELAGQRIALRRGPPSPLASQGGAPLATQAGAVSAASGVTLA